MNLTHRLRVGGLALGVILVVLLAGEQTSEAQEVSRRDRLVFGLKARHPTEVTFLEQVNAQVDARVIPADLVDRVFFLVHEEKGDTKYPFIYFERILRMQGTKIGVPIPPYNGPFR